LRWRLTTPAQRRTLLAAGLGWMLDAFDVMLYSLVLATLMTEFGMSKGTAGLLNSLTLVASAVGSLIFGLLADRHGRRRMLSVSILTYSIFTFACGLSTTLLMLAAFRFLLGLGMGGEWNTGAALVAETWPASWRGRALGIVQSSWAIGYALAAATAWAILPRAGWRWVFFVGVVPALIALWIRQGVPEPEVWKRQAGVAGPAAGPKAGHGLRTAADHGPTRGDAGVLWHQAAPRLLVLLGMNTCGMFAWWGLFTWLPAYLELPVAQGGRGFNLHGTGPFLVALNLIGMWPGYLVFGLLADRVGRKRMLILYLALAALLVPWFAAARQPVALFAAATLVAFFGTGFFTGSSIVGSELFPTPIRATALGLSYNVARGLSALAPLTIGVLGQSHGLSWAFGACGIAFALAAAFAFLLPETKGTVIA
jgi:MFS family permease